MNRTARLIILISNLLERDVWDLDLYNDPILVFPKFISRLFNYSTDDKSNNNDTPPSDSSDQLSTSSQDTEQPKRIKRKNSNSLAILINLHATATPPLLEIVRQLLADISSPFQFYHILGNGSILDFNSHLVLSFFNHSRYLFKTEYCLEMSHA